ncbi:MAG: iron transporter FeoA [Bdellovibrionaceae bacterium]|nr:iron transporter FeoA [Pseudobdellovibrionaceae bacterium]|tara:strand:- start:41258 stop:41488 length:231 start_codon:yes stop_codon:yes gene_type:complete
MNLWSLNENENGMIGSFCESMDKKYQLRLRELGFDDSMPVRCLKTSPFGGPRVYQIGDSVFSLTQDIASSVFLVKK